MEVTSTSRRFRESGGVVDTSNGWPRVCGLVCLPGSPMTLQTRLSLGLGAHVHTTNMISETFPERYCSLLNRRDLQRADVASLLGRDCSTSYWLSSTNIHLWSEYLSYLSLRCLVLESIAMSCRPKMSWTSETKLSSQLGEGLGGMRAEAAPGRTSR